MGKSKKSKEPTKDKEQYRYDPEFIEQLAERVAAKLRQERAAR